MKDWSTELTSVTINVCVMDNDFCALYSKQGVGIAQWLECQIRDLKVPGSSPGRSGGRIFFSRVNFLC